MIVVCGNLVCMIGEFGEFGGFGFLVLIMVKCGVDSKGMDNFEVFNLMVNCCMVYGGMLYIVSKFIDLNYLFWFLFGGDLGCLEIICEVMVVFWW